MSEINPRQVKEIGSSDVDSNLRSAIQRLRHEARKNTRKGGPRDPKYKKPTWLNEFMDTEVRENG